MNINNNINNNVNEEYKWDNSVCRTNWSNECENLVNKQILLEYEASINYHTLFAYFDNSDVSLNNIANFFNKSSLEEREHAHKFIEYQNKRGGKVVIKNLENIINLNYNINNNNVLKAFELALKMEKDIYKNLLLLHKQSEDDNDPQFCDFLESEYLNEQIESINEISKYITKLKMIGDNGHGIWNFDNNFNLN